MPRLFAAGLRSAVGDDARHRRVVLLFDTHEAFFGEAVADPHALVHADYPMRDEWLRSPAWAPAAGAGGGGGGGRADPPALG